MSSVTRQKRTRADYEVATNAADAAEEAANAADEAANTAIQAAERSRAASVAARMAVAESDAASAAAAAADAALAAEYAAEYAASAAAAAASCSTSPSSNPGLRDLPVDVLKRIFTYFSKCPGDGTLDDASVEALREIFALSCVCPQLHAMLASLFHSVFFDVNGQTPAKCIVNFADSLRHISLPGSDNSADILEKLVLRKSPLESLDLNASSIPGLAISYINSLRGMSSNDLATLRYLRLSYVNIDSNVDCMALERAVRNLRALAIVGGHEGDYGKLSDLLRLTAPNLVHLELQNLKVPSESFLIDITAATPGLRHLDLINVTAKISTILVDFIVSYGSNLCHLGLWHTNPIGGKLRLLARDFMQIMRKCAGLKSFHVDESLFSKRNLAIKVFQIRESTLRSIRLYRCELRAGDITLMAKALPAMEEFAWENSRIYHNAIGELCALKGHILKSIAIWSETGFDHITARDAYFAIGNCTQLQELTLGSGKLMSSNASVETQSTWGTGYFTASGTSWSSNAPVKKLPKRARCFQEVICSPFIFMLKCLGPKLRMFSFKGYWNWLHEYAVERISNNMGAISGAYMMQLVGIYCTKLKLLHMEGIRTSTGLRSEYEAALAQLRRRLPNTALYIDRPLPHRFGRTWDGREIQNCDDLS